MNPSWHPKCVAVAAVLLTLACSAAAQEKSFVGKKLPNFTAKDASTGKSFSLEDLQGRIVLIDFWATWCGPCRAELPNVKKAYEKYHDQGFEIVSISLDSNVNTCKQFVEREEMGWMHVIEGGGWQTRLAQQYDIHSIPAMFILDANGVVVSDSARGKMLATAIENAMKKTPPTPAGDVALANAEKLLADKEYVKAMEAFESIVESNPDSEAATAARNHLDEMRKDPAIAKALDAAREKEAQEKMERETSNWLRMARSLVQAGNMEAARKNYQKIIDNYPDSEAAATAKAEMRNLRK